MGWYDCAGCSARSMSCDDFCHRCCDVNDGEADGYCDGCDALAEKWRKDCNQCSNTFCREHGLFFTCCGKQLCGDGDKGGGCREEHETVKHPSCGHETCNYYREEEKELNCRVCDGLKIASKTATTKKKKKPSTGHFKCSLTDLSTEDLRTMQHAIDKELKTRRTVHDMMSELEEAYDAIDWGYSDWKSEKTGDAVRELQSLHVKEAEVTQAILALTDVEEKWDAALTFSASLASMISTAEDNAGKLVNGSAGEWCPDTASAIESLWEQLVASGSFPSDSIREEVCSELAGILGDYEQGLQSTLDKIQLQPKAPKRLKTSSAKPAVIDLT